MNLDTGSSGNMRQENTDDFTVKWIHGSPDYRNPVDPPIQVYWYNPDTVIMRQSKELTQEAPFLYLLLGEQRALLLDTGAVSDSSVFSILDVVDSLISKWHKNGQNENYELTVAHSHSHYDHVSGDSQFDGRPNTKVVGKEVDSVKSFFGISDWPDTTVKFDLGDRVLEIIPSPGHHENGISIFDLNTGILLTGDTVYPGRLYVSDYPAFLGTLDRLVRFSRENGVKHVLGCHIEMSSIPGKDYPAGALYQPDEPSLQMSVEQLIKIRDSAMAVSGRKGAHIFDDFIIFNGPCYGAVIKQLLRAAVSNFKYKHGKT